MKRLPRLDLNLLQIFDAIYTKGGVSAAASHLNLSQPAISHALAKLRAMLDDPLFIRQGNRLVPTGTARAVAEPIHTALRELVAALDGAGSFDPAQSTREFRIGIRLAGEMSRFPALASRVLADAPHVRLISTAFRRRDLVAALANGDLDVAIDVDDRAGVLASVADAFAQYDVSIKTVRQEGHGSDAQLVIVTHEADDAALAATVEVVRALDMVRDVSSVMRVEGLN